MPAWNDANLRDLAQQIETPLFFAHVRASTGGTATSRDNCHPFRVRNLLFMHNGEIGEFMRIRRDIEQRIKPEHYAYRHGTTDSEAFFLLALGNGLEDSPLDALADTISQVEQMMAAADVTEPFHMTAAFSDGDGLVALRHSSDGNSPTLYYAMADNIEVDNGTVAFAEGEGTVLVLSEPLDDAEQPWHEVPENHCLIARGGTVEVKAFAPS